MNPFGWLIRLVENAFDEGQRRWLAKQNPDAPPPTAEQVRAILTGAEPPALSASEFMAEPDGPAGKTPQAGKKGKTA